MAVQRSLGWATTKKSITMTGQSKRKPSLYQSFDSPQESRKNSLELPNIEPLNSDEGVNNNVEELIKFSARKFSIFVPLKSRIERTILDDADYFMNKKECDYGMCDCCVKERKLQTNWESIEEIIENDPEIIFDCDDNPIVVEPIRESILPINQVGNGLLTKRLGLDKLPELFKNICNKISDTTLT